MRLSCVACPPSIHLSRCPNLRDYLTELAWWAHARREFFEMWKASGSAAAKAAVERIGELYGIEAGLRGVVTAVRRDTTTATHAQVGSVQGLAGRSASKGAG